MSFPERDEMDECATNDVPSLVAALDESVRAHAQVTEDLRRSDDRFGLLVQSIKDYAIFFLDPEGRIRSWNEGAQRLKGYATREILGRHFSIFYPPEDVARGLPERLLALAERDGRVEHEGWRLRQDGSRFWADVVITALRDAEGRLVGYGKVTRDLTDRRQAEEALRQSEERFRLMLESVRDYAIFMLDPTGRILSWNPGAERFKGYREDEIIGRHFSTFYLPEDVAHGLPDRLLRQAEQEGRAEHEGWRVRRDGTHFWADVVISAVRDRSGRLVGYVKVTRDLSARKEAEEERVHLAQERAARRSAEESVRQRDEFLGVAAHELKTPVTSLQLGIQFVGRRLDQLEALDAPGVREALDMVEGQARKLTDLVNNLLDFSRVINGRLALELLETDLAALAREIVDRLRAISPGRTIALEAPEPLILSIDPLRLEQVLTNLVDNALKYGGAGPIEVTVERPAPDRVTIAVRDHGPGVPIELRAHLFNRFYQTDSRNAQVGLGLGLSISTQIVQQHGGTLTAEFPPDGGSRFIVTLPAGPAVGAAPPR